MLKNNWRCHWPRPFGRLSSRILLNSDFGSRKYQIIGESNESCDLAANTFPSLPSAALARGIFRTNAASSSARYSWAVIDGEHGLIGDKDYYEVGYQQSLSWGPTVDMKEWSWIIQSHQRVQVPLFECHMQQNGQSRELWILGLMVLWLQCVSQEVSLLSWLLRSFASA